MTLRQTVMAWTALTITILIWGSYLVSTRAAMTQELYAYDVGFLRSVPAAIAMLPFILKRGLKPKSATWLDVLVIGGMGGTIFTFLLATGFKFAPTVDGGLFTPSMLPVWVVLLTIAFFGNKYRMLQFIGIALVLVGALAVGGSEAISNAGSGAWRGHLLFLTASLCWASYTVRFTAAGLDPIDGAVMLVGWSGIIFTLCIVCFGTKLTELPLPSLFFQLFQRFITGYVSNFTFLYAVRNLGSAIPAAFAALVPVIGAIGGWLFLAEPITSAKWLGILIIGTGVVLASGAFVGRLKAAR